MGVALSTILREKNKGCQDEGWKGEKEAKKKQSGDRGRTGGEQVKQNCGT